MARGSEAKSIITNKILETFNGSFINDKEIRIPIMENGETLQIKCVLTCAKTNIEANAGSNFPDPIVKDKVPKGEFTFEISDQEKSEVSDLISKLGL